MTSPDDAIVTGARFAALARAGVDLATIATWNPGLPRRVRLLVPADVQAYVVPADGAEPTLAVTGGPGDPPPFETGAPRPAGVHLHWAMPDALLRGRQSSTTAELALPALPDHWAVVRTLLPSGGSVAAVRGWVIDARLGSVIDLAGFTGEPAPAPDPAQVFDRLDGAVGGSLVWTASYQASAGRFGFHDPLDDLVPDPEADQAGYTVAGWWSDAAQDPLAGTRGRGKLDARLAELGWHVVHDADDVQREPPDERVGRLMAGMGLASPQDRPPVTVVGGGGKPVGPVLHGVDLGSGPVVDLDADVGMVIVKPGPPSYDTLVHGSVLGVPVAGPLPPADGRPDAAAIGAAIGLDLDDVLAAFGAPAMGTAPEQRAAAEQLVAAFTGELLDRLGTPDGLAELAEREHGDGFWSLPGAALPGAKPDRLRAEDSTATGPLTVGRKGRGATAPAGVVLDWFGTDLGTAGKGQIRSERIAETAPAPTGPAAADVREVVRPAPRWFRPRPPALALRGARPHHRHHGDGLFDDSGRLRCRYPAECVPGIEGVVDGADVVPTLGSGALPPEVLAVVRESVLLNPYGYRWLARAGARGDDGVTGPFTNRVAGEMVRLYGVAGRYDGSSHLTAPPGASWAGVSAAQTAIDGQLAAELAGHSLLPGTPPSPVALTTWRQPWVPLWVEWQVGLDGSAGVEGVTLDGLDLEPSDETPAAPVSVQYSGRSPLDQGAATAVNRGIAAWLAAEQQRDATPRGSVLTDAQEAALGGLRNLLVPLDLVSASLDGLREQLLGVDYVGVLTGDLPTATDTPVPLFGGTLRLDALRLVDAFGRTLDVPVDAVATTAALEVPGTPAAITLRPRVQHLARWAFRLVDPAQTAAEHPARTREAFVDQLDPALAVNPVAGFLLPDHVDEALELFATDGRPLGQLAHHAVSGAVGWEPAPGLPPDAGPLAGLAPAQRVLGEIAAGLVRSDATTRATEPRVDSALTALLRAVDTTLWTVDTFAAVGSASVAGLVGRPIAVVRATLRLEAPDDLDEVIVDEDAAPARRKAFAALAEQRFPVRLGALDRSDDALLGYFVDDDHGRLHLVDAAVAALARDSGRHRGQLGLLGADPVPGVVRLEHPFLVDDDVLWLRAGQTVTLTLLMLPAGRVHVTSGVLPRKALALADDWVSPGLARLVPSLRAGPLLVDPAEIRLPLVDLLGERQAFTSHDGPLSWRDDPIVAATQTAYLPRLPHEIVEGWIRVTPTDDPDGSAP